MSEEESTPRADHPFVQRRREVCRAIGDDGIAIFLSGTARIRSHDTDYRFRAASEVLYLTGFPEPDAVVVLAPGHETGPLTLFVRPRDPEMETWTGRRYGVEGAIERFGADAAFPITEIETELPKLLEGRRRVFHRLGVDTRFDERLLAMFARLRRRKGKPPANPNTIVDHRSVLEPMRRVKDPTELSLIRRACAISAEAHRAAMKACRPGRFEYELQAVIEYIFASEGAEHEAYSTIVGTGDNATILHYTENRDEIRDGDLVLIDAGAEYQGYAGDITRTFPANGKFSGPQRDLYQAVLDAEEAAIAECVVGNTWKAIHEATVQRLTAAMVDLKLLEGDVDALIEDESYKRFFMHKTGHWLGIDVHDPNPYYDGDEPLPLTTGMVQTIEPGLYIPANAEDVPDEFRGMGIRIEDDVLTSEEGPIVLTGDVPKAVAEVEELVGSGLTLTL